jgi:Phosphotransferase enzyme family
MVNEEQSLSGGSRTSVTLRDGVVRRAAGPWSPAVIALLQHLQDVGFEASPAVIGTGFAPDGRETLAYVPGDFVHPGPWPDAALPEIGAMLAQLHLATRSFVPPPLPNWQSWFGRSMGAPSVIGHCDLGAWNIVARQGRPVAFIDWEVAGPVDPRVELAQVCWLNALLFDDDISKREGLATPDVRAGYVRCICDGYGLAAALRTEFVDVILEFVIRAAAQEAIDAAVTPETTDPEPLWAIAWRTRSAAWILNHRGVLERALA